MRQGVRKKSEKGMLIIYSEKVKKECGRGKDPVKVDLFMEPQVL